MTTHEKKVLVIGHKNPDTDSICSAIAYAYLKEQQTGKKHVPRCCGEINAETAYILKRFGVAVPDYIEYVGTQVKDIDIREMPGVDRDMSLKRAWLMMQDKQVVTLCITDGEGHLDGLITISDIAKATMELSDSGILSAASTPFENILDTLDGVLVTGETEGRRYTAGKVLIAAANPDLMEDYIKQGDLVILGNRYESQLCAIEMGASCLVVCEGAKVSKTIIRLAEEHGCVIIQSPHDAFTVARLIDLSMPIGYFMTTENLITFRTDDYIDSIRDVMAKRRNRDFPILDHKGIFRGTVSRRNLMDMRRKQVILVDHNEPGQAVDGIQEADILEIIDHHRIGGMYTFQPVYFRNEPVGCTATIIYLKYRELGIEIPKNIAALLCSAILSDTLAFHSPTCTVIDKDAVEKLAEIAEIEPGELARSMFAAGSHLTERSPEEIFYQDYKKFKIGSTTMGVGQVNSMSREELSGIEERLKPYILGIMKRSDIKMLFFMMTNIIEESSRILFAGDGAREVIEEAFGVKAEGNVCEVPKLVSRKKQFVPGISTTLQN